MIAISNNTLLHWNWSISNCSHLHVCVCCFLTKSNWQLIMQTWEQTSNAMHNVMHTVTQLHSCTETSLHFHIRGWVLKASTSLIVLFIKREIYYSPLHVIQPHNQTIAWSVLSSWEGLNRTEDAAAFPSQLDDNTRFFTSTPCFILHVVICSCKKNNVENKT